MPKYYVEKVLPYSQKELFDLVSDVEKYPEYLPWCEAIRILEKGASVILAEMVVDFKGVHGKYTSRVLLDEDEGEISVELAQGPFKHLYQGWKFTPRHLSTLVEFDIDFEMRSKVLEKVMNLMFKDACDKIMHAFEKRAEALYHPMNE